MCNNNNNNNGEFNNNNYIKPQDHILFFKLTKGTRNNLLDTYRKFGHTPSKRVTSPFMKHIVVWVTGCKLNAHNPA